MLNVILREIDNHGLRVNVVGDNQLNIYPKENITPSILETLKQNKELLCEHYKQKEKTIQRVSWQYHFNWYLGMAKNARRTHKMPIETLEAIAFDRTVKDWIRQHLKPLVPYDAVIEEQRIQQATKALVKAGLKPCKSLRQIEVENSEEFQERAAIMEYEGGMSREEAERQALKALLN